MKTVVDALDLFRVVQPENEQVLSGKTRAGGVLGIFCSVVITLLVTSEFIRFFSPAPFKSEMGVASHEMNKREVWNFNVSFLHFPCGFLRFEAFQANAGLRLTKQEETLQWTRTRLLKGDPNVELGTYDSISMSPERTVNEGCRAEGRFSIDKVPSNMVLSLASPGGPQTEPPPSDLIFHDMWFGEKRLPLNEIPEALANPLAGVRRDGDGPRTIYQYFLSIVPTVVTDSSKRGKDARHVGFQYTAISSTVQAFVPPGLYFAHHHSPIEVEMRRDNESWSHFLVWLASISGGVYVVTELAVNALTSKFVKEHMPEPLREKLFGDGDDGGSMLK